MNSERFDYQPRTEQLRPPEFSFSHPDTLLFLTGVPLSGKSSIAPLVAANITGCSLQPMDVVRLFAQEMEQQKPAELRNPFVNFGSCDSYSLVGDGTDTPENTIEGFVRYAQAVSSLVTAILPKLETQGVRNLLFEGVQLTPHILQPHLKEHDQVLIVTTTKEQLEQNITTLFGDDEAMKNRYSIEKLLLLQDEILRQSADLSPQQVLTINNTTTIPHAGAHALSALQSRGILTHK